MQVHHVEHKYQGSSDRYRNSTAYLVVQHAAAIYRAGIAALDAVHDYHTQRWGTGVGYHEVLLEEPNGEIGCYVVSDPNLLRFHVAYRNDHAWGISCLTNFADQIPAEKWIQALAERLRVAQKQWSDARVVGHRDIALPPWESPDGKDWRTSCPGMRWPQWKNRLIELVSNASSQPDITRVWEVMRDVAYAAVRTAPSRTAPKALNDTAALPSGAQFEVDAIATGESIGGNNLWAHMAPPNDLGFIHTSIVAPVAQPPSSVIPAVPYTLDETSPVLGPASVQEAQVAAFIKRKGTLYSSVSVD